MKYFTGTVLLLFGLVLSASGDDFEDLIQACARISTNYNRAVQSPGTRFDKEFQAYLENLKQLSRQVQSVIRRMQLGQDFDFPQMILELESIYQGAQQKTGAKGESKLYAHSESPEGILRVLTDDVKALRKMQFTTEDGGSIQTSQETKRKLREFRRLVDFFRKNYRRIHKNPQRKDVSLERIFQHRMIRMSALAGILMQMARKKYPDTLSRSNLQTEVMHLNRCFEILREKTAANSRNRSSRSRNGRKNNLPSIRRIDGLNSTASIYAEIDLSLRNINDLLIHWEQAGFQSDDPISRGRGETDSGDPAAVLQGKTEVNHYESMNQKELLSLLNRRREHIFRSNHSMDGFDRESERLFLLTLTREQKRVYNLYLRDFQQQGYSAGQAIRSAVLKIHTKIQLENESVPIPELIRILEALDREKERRLEKDKLQFKLERSRIERD